MRRLLIFLKEPIPGFVKTRIAKIVGYDNASLLASQLFDDVFATALQYQQQASEPVELQLVVAPDPNAAHWDAYRHLPSVTIRAQSGGDLGKRLWHGVAPLLNMGDSVICIGMDCPFLTVEDFDEAFESLTCKDVVIQPAEDGGYVLLGLSNPVQGLFEEMPWSTHLLLRETCQFLDARGLSYELRPTLSDIDDLESAKAWLAGKGMELKCDKHGRLPA